MVILSWQKDNTIFNRVLTHRCFSKGLEKAPFILDFGGMDVEVL